MYNKSDLDVTNKNIYDVWVGCDVSKDTFDVSLAIQNDYRKFPTASFSRSKDGVNLFIEWAKEQIKSKEYSLHIVMESTGKYSLQLFSWMVQISPSLKVSIENPSIIKSFIDSLGFRNKTDATDARALACYGQQRHPEAYQPQSKAYSDLRELVRYRQNIVDSRTQYMQRLQAMEKSSPAYKMCQRDVKQFEKKEEEILTAIKKIVTANSELRKDVELLDQIVGVGFVVAVTVLGELGDLRRFETARAITAFAGLSPQRHESGTSVHKRTTISKKGNPHVRHAVYMAALSIVRRDNDLARVYERLIAAGKAKMSALGAVARKLLVLMRIIIISGKPYEKCYNENLMKTA